MRLEKAYEYFSAYYEGSLDAAMRSQLDRMFEAHSVLRKDFESFAQTMEDLDSSFATEVPIPHDLHDRISARIDRAAHEAAQSKPVGVAVMWRRLAFGGLAFILIGGAAFSLLNRGTNGRTEASAIPSMIERTTNADLRVEANGKGTFLKFQPGSRDTVHIVRLPDGKVVETYKVAPNQALDIPLQNKSDQAVALRISTEVGKDVLTVVVPGSSRTQVNAGEGKVLDLAMTISSFFGRPVVIDSDSLTAAVRWELNKDNLTQSSVTPSGVSLEIKDQLVRLHY